MLLIKQPMKTVTVISPSHKNVSHFIHSLPDIFHSEGVSIYKARNEIKNFTVGDTVYTVKGYKRPHFVNKIAYGVFRQSKAKRAFLYADRLLSNGVSTPQPVAYIEQYQGGLLMNSYFVSLFSPESHILRELIDIQIAGNEELLVSFAAFTASVHNRNIYPIDYSPGNVLFDRIDGKFHFTLLDINRMKFGSVSRKMAARSFRRLQMNRDILIFIAAEYARLQNYPETDFTNEVLRYHTSFWSKH